ncbi:unnamed protein product [Rotaria sordida]|uniref:Reverse transcriptase RNase H-like domain-containing protein n=1 Tax=Rotaria sordida TaxID=392033 RepID=A0A814LUP9_9BILA|nr:unnamed protein product [Rotaria sordida]
MATNDRQYFITIHSIIHNQLSAPQFKNLIKSGFIPAPIINEIIGQIEKPTDPVKCSIFHQQIAYLSHTISEHGVKRTNEKIQAIFKLRQPTKLAEANKFLGALSWYHDNYPVILTMDASEIGTGGTLQQNINGKIQNLYDHSQVTSSTQRRYDPIELEALAIWLCFQRMRSYLLGRSIIIYTDHCPLCKMMNSSVKNR